MDVQIDLAKAAKAYGNLKAWSRRLGIPYTTVRGWLDGGPPDWRHERILAVAKEDGADVVAEPKTKKRSSRTAA